MSHESPANPIESFKEILPEGLSPEIGEKLLKNIKERLDAGETIESLIGEYQTKREEALPKNDIEGTINSDGTINVSGSN